MKKSKNGRSGWAVRAVTTYVGNFAYVGLEIASFVRAWFAGTDYSITRIYGYAVMLLLYYFAKRLKDVGFTFPGFNIPGSGVGK